MSEKTPKIINKLQIQFAIAMTWFIMTFVIVTILALGLWTGRIGIESFIAVTSQLALIGTFIIKWLYDAQDDSKDNLSSTFPINPSILIDFNENFKTFITLYTEQQVREEEAKEAFKQSMQKVTDDLTKETTTKLDEMEKDVKDALSIPPVFPAKTERKLNEIEIPEEDRTKTL